MASMQNPTKLINFRIFTFHFLFVSSFSGMKNFLHLNKLIAVWIFTFSIFKNPKAAHHREIHLKKNNVVTSQQSLSKNSSSSCLAFRKEDSIGCAFVQLNPKNLQERPHGRHLYPVLVHSHPQKTDCSVRAPLVVVLASPCGVVVVLVWLWCLRAPVFWLWCLRAPMVWLWCFCGCGACEPLWCG